jgi:hypothetical protein
MRQETPRSRRTKLGDLGVLGGSIPFGGKSSNRQIKSWEGASRPTETILRRYAAGDLATHCVPKAVVRLDHAATGAVVQDEPRLPPSPVAAWSLVNVLGPEHEVSKAAPPPNSFLSGDKMGDA